MQQPKISTHKTQWSSTPPQTHDRPPGHPLTNSSSHPHPPTAGDPRRTTSSPAAAASDPAETGQAAPETGSGGGGGSSDLDARYGRDGKSRRWLVIGVLAVVVAAGLAWLIWAAVVGSNPPVTSRLLGFEVTSPTAAKATIQVDRTKSVEANCRLQAKAADFSIVGEVTLTVSANSPRHQTLPVTVTTQRAATSVVLIGCTTADSPRPH